MPSCDTLASKNEAGSSWLLACRLPQAVQRGARLISITDSRMSPLAREAQVALMVEDSPTLGFRSLSSTMALAESLFIALAYRLELPNVAGRQPAPA